MIKIASHNSNLRWSYILTCPFFFLLYCKFSLSLTPCMAIYVPAWMSAKRIICFNLLFFMPFAIFFFFFFCLLSCVLFHFIWPHCTQQTTTTAIHTDIELKVSHTFFILPEYCMNPFHLLPNSTSFVLLFEVNPYGAFFSYSFILFIFFFLLFSLWGILMAVILNFIGL